MRHITLSILSVIALLGLAACGSDEKQPITVVTTPSPAVSTTNTAIPTKGQQLQDLQKAYDKDAIDSDEYKAQKARILSE